ncbi:MAG: helix-turn-helix protein [Rhodospirillales bacterium]|nr:helix-turn-helix protein [Rhodospirillales bacterium]
MRNALIVTVGYIYDPANPPKPTQEQRTRLDGVTEELIEANAPGDPDNPPLTDVELATAFRSGDIRDLRQRLGLSQSTFAQRFGVNLRTLQEWEQGRRAPDQIARSYLRVISLDPDAVARALAAA